MAVVLFADIWHYVFGIGLFTTAVFLILLVLIQRGKGGGLVGAFGGMGGQSAFGTKAGDTVMWVTVGAAILWGILCLASIVVLSSRPVGDASPDPTLSPLVPGGTERPQDQPPLPGATSPGATSPGAEARSPAGEVPIPKGAATSP